MEGLLCISIQGTKQSRLGFIGKRVSGARDRSLSLALFSAGFWGEWKYGLRLVMVYREQDTGMGGVILRTCHGKVAELPFLTGECGGNKKKPIRRHLWRD